MPRAVKYSTIRAAATAVGMTAPGLRQWIKKGWLPDGPWTAHQLHKALEKSRQTAGRGSQAEHGTTSRWRAGCNCDLCADAHNTEWRHHRERRRRAEWVGRDQALIDTLAGGTPYAEALAHHEVTAQAVTAHRRRDVDFAARLDAALLAGRDPGLGHGTSGAWRHGCRCPECREHHNEHRDGAP